MPKHKNTELKKKSKALAELIEQSFQDLPYPGDEGLVVIRGECDLERQEIQESFVGKHWKTLSVKFLNYHHQSLFFLTPAAYRFYLPAYLRACILFYDQSGNIPDSVIFSLSPPEEYGSEMEKFLANMNGFTPNQKKAIAAFLELFFSEYSQDFPAYNLDSVLSRYWLQFK